MHARQRRRPSRPRSTTRSRTPDLRSRFRRARVRVAGRSQPWAISLFRNRGQVAHEEADGVLDGRLVERFAREQVEVVAGVVPDLRLSRKCRLGRGMRWSALVEVGDLHEHGTRDRARGLGRCATAELEAHVGGDLVDPRRARDAEVVLQRTRQSQRCRPRQAWRRSASSWRPAPAPWRSCSRYRGRSRATARASCASCWHARPPQAHRPSGPRR